MRRPLVAWASPPLERASGTTGHAPLDHSRRQSWECCDHRGQAKGLRGPLSGHTPAIAGLECRIRRHHRAPQAPGRHRLGEPVDTNADLRLSACAATRPRPAAVDALGVGKAEGGAARSWRIDKVVSPGHQGLPEDANGHHAWARLVRLAPGHQSVSPQADSRRLAP